MRKTSLLVACLSISLLLTSAAYATIIDYTCGADGDGAIDIAGPLQWEDTGLEGGIATYTMSMDALQSRGPAHMVGDFVTDTPEDPIVWIMEDVENATGFTWTGYEFKVFMDKTFAITNVMAPMGWVYTVGDIAPVLEWPEGLGGPGYVRVVSYTANAGYEIDPTEIGTFGVRLQFDGSVAFCTEQTPIPEPMTMVLLGLGGLFAFRRK